MNKLGNNRYYYQDFSENDTQSAKGLKVGNNLVIENGIINLDTSNDAIHSNTYVGSTTGTFEISSGDDEIHVDT